MIKEIFLSLITGIIVTLFLAQYDSWVHEQIGLLFKQAFENSLDCSISFDVARVRFFKPALELEHVSVYPQKEHADWSWQCTRYRTGFSWWHLLRYATIDMWVAVDELQAKSHIRNNVPAIMEHIQELMEGPDFFMPTFLKSLTLSKACLFIADGDLDACVRWNSESKKINDRFRTHFYVTDGHFTAAGRSCVTNLRGNCALDAMEGAAGSQYKLQIDTCGTAPQLQDGGTCFFSGVWSGDHGRFAVRNSEQSLVIDPIIITEKEKRLWLEATAHVPFSYLRHFVGGRLTEIPVTGSCLMHVQGTWEEPAWFDGYIALEDIRYEHIQSIFAGKLSFHKRGKRWTGDLDMRIPSVAEFHGSWRWHEQTGDGSATITNGASVLLPCVSYWHVDPYDFLLRMKIESDGKVSGTYHCTITNSLLKSALHASGDVGIQVPHIYSSGKLHANTYELEADMYTVPYIKRLLYSNEQGAQLINVQRVPSDVPILESTVQVAFIRSLLYQWLQYDVQGEGNVQMRTTFGDEKIAAKLHLDDGTIRLPQTYNFIDGFKAELLWDMQQYKMVMRNMSCSLHTGRVWSERAVAWFEKTGRLAALHLPLLFDRCLLNIKQDLFTMLSGTVLLSKQYESAPLLQGRLILDRSQLKENLFSPAVQKQLARYTGDVFDISMPDILCDVSLETKDPVRVDTDFLQANAQVNLLVKNSIAKPEISGSITVNSGILKFPYKPLNITKGTISFVPDEPYNPLVELTAKNKIKKYGVVLHVTGSLLNHSVILESTPSLTEEQVVALLLVGSEEDSLNMIMPALIVQNMKNLIFSSDQTAVLERYFKPWIKPFTIHLVPSFSDQTGRGGLRGSIEIDVNDRWRALIQKNFSLTEDTRFELEYRLSDDVTLRGIRDERRDIAVEAEMKWKL